MDVTIKQSLKEMRPEQRPWDVVKWHHRLPFKRVVSLGKNKLQRDEEGEGDNISRKCKPQAKYLVVQERNRTVVKKRKTKLEFD